MNTQFTPYGEIVENFATYNDIENWFLIKKLIKEKTVVSIEEQKKYYNEIINYRTLLRNSFKEYIQLGKSLDNLIKITNDIIIKSETFPQLLDNDGSFILGFISKRDNYNIFLTLIAIEVMSLLYSKEFKYLKKCDNHKCSLFFIDISKNHSRRWCSMEICGNRSKVSNFNKRKKNLL